MKKRILLPILLILSLLCLLTSCSGNKLPEGITETQLLTQGRAVVTALNEEQWQQVYEQLREDAQQTTSPEDIQSVVSAVFEKAGAFKSESDVLLTGQKLKSGERTVGVPITQTCKCCGKTFEARSTAKLFCDVNCRAKYYRQEAAKERSRELTCEHCGKVFTTT